MSNRILFALPSLVLVGCAQLPQNTAIPINKAPNFDSSAIISSKNGIIAADITKVPGRLCVPAAATGLCDANGFVPGQYLTKDAKINVAATTNTQPMYHSLINNKYTMSLDTPFVSPSGSDETYDDVKVTIVATATVADGTQNAGYPGISAIRKALQNAGMNKNVTYVYWISAANTILVSNTSYTKVSSATKVTGTGFGASGSTYNYAGTEQETVWIGILAHKIDITETAPVNKGKGIVKSLNLPFKGLPPAEHQRIFNIKSNGNFADTGKK
jgi:hypothetical protein